MSFAAFKRRGGIDRQTFISGPINITTSAFFTLKTVAWILSVTTCACPSFNVMTNYSAHGSNRHDLIAT